MTLVSPTQVNPDDEVTDSSVNTPVNQLAGVINGNLDDTNISGFSGSKIAAGTLPVSAATADANVETRMSESLGNFIASGCIWSAISGLNGSMTSGIAYVNGKRLTVAAVSSYTFTANKDTYVSVDYLGNVDYSNEVANSAPPPSLPANSVWLAKVITDGSSVTSVVTSGYAGTDPIYPNTAVRPQNLVQDSTDYGFMEIGRATLTSAGDTITVQDLPARKYLRVYVWLIASGDIQGQIRFNGDSGNNYSYRSAANGASDVENTSKNSVVFTAGTASHKQAIIDAFNTATHEKNFFWQDMERATGANNAPGRVNGWGRWANNAQVNRIDISNISTGDFAAGSEVVVFGHD